MKIVISYVGNFIFIILLLLGLKQINVLQNAFGLPAILVVVSVLGTEFLVRQQKVQEIRKQSNDLNYENLDWIRYISAILIILLHLRPFQNRIDPLDLAINNIVGRICVPLYFLITGYFVAKKQQKDREYIRHYIYSMLPFYLLWSLLYLPVTLHMIIYQSEIIQPYLPNFPLAVWILLIPVVLIILLVYAGVHYHLWYFPALFFSLGVVDWWQKKFSLKLLLIVSFLLLILGASETYYGILSQPIQTFIGYYYRVFITSRNGLFFGLFYVVLGYCMGKKKSLYTSHLNLKLVVCVLFLVMEGLFLQSVERLNSNILLACIPLSYYLFVTMIYSNTWFNWPLKTSLRDLYKYYYILHPLVIYLCSPLILEFQKNHSILFSLGIIVLTHLLTLFVLYLKKYFEYKLRWL